MTNASHNGTAVSASAKLCTVSASNATDPLAATITACTSAVIPRPMSEIFSARMPTSLVSSTRPVVSWLWG